MIDIQNLTREDVLGLNIVELGILMHMHHSNYSNMSEVKAAEIRERMFVLFPEIDEYVDALRKAYDDHDHDLRDRTITRLLNEQSFVVLLYVWTTFCAQKEENVVLFLWSKLVYAIVFNSQAMYDKEGLGQLPSKTQRESCPKCVNPSRLSF